jgi:hypothetical protein
MQGCLVLASMVFAGQVPAAQPDPAAAAAALRAKHIALAEPLRHNAFQRPVVLESNETAHGVQGDVYAEVDYEPEALAKALNGPAHWCEVLLLHINNKQCRASESPRASLSLGILRKYDQALDQAMGLTLAYRPIAASRDYLEVDLTSPDGPMGTTNYRIVLQAVPLAGGGSFLHFMYAYDTGMFASLATQAYLATSGSAKVGFTVVGRRPDGEPDYIRGVRGLMERNAMRYFLAIEAFLEAAKAAVPEQFDKRLELWFSATERYPRQLHEMDKPVYLAIKRADRQRDHGAR